MVDVVDDVNEPVVEFETVPVEVDAVRMVTVAALEDKCSVVIVVEGFNVFADVDSAFVAGILLVVEYSAVVEKMVVLALDTDGGAAVVDVFDAWLCFLIEVDAEEGVENVAFFIECKPVVKLGVPA